MSLAHELQSKALAVIHETAWAEDRTQTTFQQFYFMLVNFTEKIYLILYERYIILL